MSRVEPIRLEDLPEILTVEEVQLVLRVGRSKAYEIARRLRVPGIGVVRVPRRAIEEMLSGESKPLRAMTRGPEAA